MPEGPDGKTIIIIKKVSGHGGHHGGAWKVAYADFVTAMMAFFMVLWLVNSASVSTRERIANYFREPGVFDKGSGTPIEEGGAGILPDAFSPPAVENSKAIHSDRIYKVNTALGEHPDAFDVSEGSGKGEEEIRIKQQSDLEEIEQQLKKQIEAAAKIIGPDAKLLGKIEIKVDQRGLHIEIMDTDKASMFASGSSEMSSIAVDELTKIARILATLPNPVDIEGHTDGKPYNAATRKNYDNWDLSTDRANAARRVLVRAGIQAKQIARVVGYADQRLKVPNDPFAPANRRISISMRFTELAQKALAGTKTEVTESRPVKPLNGATKNNGAKPPLQTAARETNNSSADKTTGAGTPAGKTLTVEVGTSLPEGNPVQESPDTDSQQPTWMEKDKIFGNRNPFFGQ
jgi:chemotaxis protein MotB